MTDTFSVSSDALPESTRVVTIAGSESISRPYRFEIQFLMGHDDSAGFDLAAAINAKTTLGINREDGTPKYAFHGVLASVELVHELPAEGLYRAVLVPKLWQATNTHHSRV